MIVKYVFQAGKVISPDSQCKYPYTVIIVVQSEISHHNISQYFADKSLPSNSYIHLYDSSPYKIVEGHIAAKLPCNENGLTEVQILMGHINDLEAFNLAPINELSDPGNLCQYVTDIKSTNETTITDIALQNSSTEDIEFPTTSSVIVSVKEIAELPLL